MYIKISLFCKISEVIQFILGQPGRNNINVYVRHIEMPFRYDNLCHR